MIDYLQLETNDICNLKCIMCCTTTYKDRNGCMSEAVFDKCLQLIKEFGIKTVNLTGFGEPLLDPNLFHRIRAIKKNSPETTVFFTTNATLLTEEIVFNISKSMCDFVVLSFDAGSADIYEKIRKNADFQRTVKNIDLLTQKMPHIPVAVNYVVMNSNLDDMENAVRLFINLRIKTVSFYPMLTVSSAEQLKLLPDLKLFKEKWNLLKKKYGEQISFGYYGSPPVFGCLATPERRLYINAAGEIYPCCHLGTGEARWLDKKSPSFKLKLGNILTTQPEQILKHPALRSLLRDMKIGKTPKVCTGCIMMQHHCWPFILYALLKKLGGSLKQSLLRVPFVKQILQIRELVEKTYNLQNNNFQKISEICLNQKRENAQISALTHYKVIDALDNFRFPPDFKLKCGICGFHDTKENFRKVISHCRFNGGRLERFVCPQCGCIFGPLKMTMLSQKELSDDYRLCFSGYSWPIFAHELMTAQSVVTNKEKVYLNYGAGGDLLMGSTGILRKRGFNVYSYDPYAPADEAPDWLIRNADELSTMKFDAIYSNDLLEHLLDPIKEVVFMKTLLKDEKSFMEHSTSCFEYRQEFTRFHLFFFTGKSLDVLCSKTGMRKELIANEERCPGHQYISYRFYSAVSGVDK